MMTAFILMFIFISLVLFIPVAAGYRKHAEMRHVDYMAGDEGDD